MTEETNTDFKKFLCEAEAKVGCKLYSLLIVPVQRVPRYQLLFKELLSRTSSTHKEYAALEGNYIKTMNIKL
jgi:hypothetical protein